MAVSGKVFIITCLTNHIYLVDYLFGIGFDWKSIINSFKACVRYFLSIFYFSPSDSPLKTMKNVYFISRARFVLEIFKVLFFRLLLFFSLSAIALEVDWR